MLPDMSLFDTPETLNLPDAQLIFAPNCFPKSEADAFLDVLLRDIAWQQGSITMFGKSVLEPRLTAWYGDEGKSYKYSGKINVPLPWTPELRAIKAVAERYSGATFNSVLLNYYRHGNDSMGWHADDEPELGKNPVIASVNFGETRRFLLRRRDDKTVKHEIALGHGALLVMGGAMQHYWVHAVPKEPKKNQPRLNLTFRTII